MTDVRCSVSNCAYWAKGSICTARDILISAGPPETQSETIKHAHEAEVQKTPTDSDVYTHCHTFEKSFEEEKPTFRYRGQ